MSELLRTNTMARIIQNLLNNEEFDHLTVKDVRNIAVTIQEVLSDEDEDELLEGHSSHMKLSDDEINKYVI